MRNITILILLFAFLTGCAVQQDVKPLSSKATYFIFDDQESFSIAGDLSAEKQVLLSSGVYQAVYESVEGTYYQGPVDAIRIVRGEITVIAQGGIYLPQKGDAPARTWVYKKSLKRYVRGSADSNSLAGVAKGLAQSTDIALHWDIPTAMKAKIQLQEQPLAYTYYPQQ